MKLRKSIKISLIVVMILWCVFLMDALLPADLRLYGVRPRNMDGLWGIAFSPFLHGSLHHLIANSTALFVLLTASLSYSRRLTVKAVLIIAVVGYGLVWLFATPNSVHIGASGIVFGLIGFLLFIGIFRMDWKALALSVAVFLFYGGALTSLAGHRPGVSWAAHFFGFLAGALSAWWTRKQWRD
jgi:membrane associated rhomboid family serine protease